MAELRQLTKDIFCCRLEDPIPDFTGRFSCFFLVNYIDDYDFAEALCKRLILAGCRYIHSYGRYSLGWDNSADFACIHLGGLDDKKLFTMTSEEHIEEEFREELYYHYLEYNESGHKYLLLYDDEECADPIIKYVTDTYARDCKLREGIALIEQTFLEMGAESEGEYGFEILRYDDDGHYIESLGPTIIKNIWSKNGFFYAVDTILYPGNPCLIVVKSEAFKGPYIEVTEPIPYGWPVEKIKSIIRSLIVEE